jgi:small GTP-binding protein
MADQFQTIPIKIIMVGAMNVGKTSLVTKYATGKIAGHTKTTKNASYVSKRKKINTLNFEIRLWDTAGQEKYKSLTKLFTKDSKIAILVYSIDSEESFNALDDWLKLVKSTNENNLNFEIRLWDTAGQEKYRSLAKIFYKDAKVIVLVYDITSKDSFVQMKEYWYEQIKQQGNKDVIIAVAANKGDLYEKRVISNEEGEEFAKQIGAIFATTSAKDDSGILELFQNLGRKIMDPTYDASAVAKKQKSDYEKEKRKQKLAEEREGRQGTVKLSNATAKKEKKGCC